MLKNPYYIRGGGGQLGYLALTIDSTTYNTIAGASNFNCPADSGSFTPSDPILVRADPLVAAKLATQKIMFDVTRHRYNECQSVEVTLRNQILEAIEDDYLHPLHNNKTDMINNAIPEVFTFLTDTYGQLFPSQLKKRERVIDDIIYNPS